ncbi:MAG TPA: ATP synthase F1 subunit epsilon [Acidimicrobiales bacterium]|nr:ATP synthase F1 subunit epsilon [Acidimicrobiales bacterium]
MANTRFELVTPTATMYSGEAEMVVCKSVDGEIAFLADHMPYIGALDPCLVRVVGPESGGEEVRVAVRSGFVEVKDNQVIMLADVALRPEEVDVAEAERDASAAGSEAEVKWAQARLETARPG